MRSGFSAIFSSFSVSCTGKCPSFPRYPQVDPGDSLFAITRKGNITQLAALEFWQRRTSKRRESGKSSSSSLQSRNAGHVASNLRQHGKHVLIAGPSGSGPFRHPKVALSLSEIVAVVGDTAKLVDVIKDRMASLIHTSVTGGKVREVFVL